MVRPEGPCFSIRVAARMVSVHPQTLRHYERLGLLRPQRSEGNVRLYSPKDIEQAIHVRRLIEDLGVNLAGVEVVLKLNESMERLRTEMEAELVRMRAEYEAEIRRLKDALARVTGQGQPPEGPATAGIPVAGPSESRDVEL